jgi:hypothetical protein
MDRLLVFIAASAIALREESADLADVLAVLLGTGSPGQTVLGNSGEQAESSCTTGRERRVLYNSDTRSPG